MKTNLAKIRTRAKIKRFSTLPRLSVFRSNKHISAQVIELSSGKVLASASDKEIKGSKTEKANFVGTQIAQKCLDNKIKQVVFDRGYYRYHGRVKTLAEAARQAKLII